MTPAALLVLGVELTRFAPADDTADLLSGSLDVVQSGAWSLSPYEGPALQPFAAVRAGRFEAGLAPAVAWGRRLATSGDGRETVVRTTEWQVELRLRHLSGPVFAGLDLSTAGARARVGDSAVAHAPTSWTIGPTAGVRAALAPRLDLALRLRLPVRLVEDEVTATVGGGLAVEWHP